MDITEFRGGWWSFSVHKKNEEETSIIPRSGRRTMYKEEKKSGFDEDVHEVLR